jgi:hypothetical protein
MGQVRVYSNEDGRMWLVQSKSDVSLLYMVHLHTEYEAPSDRRWDQALCSCPAGEAGLFCYHLALVAMTRGLLR